VSVTDTHIDRSASRGAATPTLGKEPRGAPAATTKGDQRPDTNDTEIDHDQRDDDDDRCGRDTDEQYQPPQWAVFAHVG
jgi:hypothetical protein